MKLARIVFIVIAGLFALALLVLAQVQHNTWDVNTPVDYYLTPTDYPCLTETVHVTGSFEEKGDWFFTPSSGLHWNIHQKTKNMTAVGLDTGMKYAYSGPLTGTQNGVTDVLDNPVVETWINHNHYVGPGDLGKIDVLFVWKATWDIHTGEVKVEVSKPEFIQKSGQKVR